MPEQALEIPEALRVANLSLLSNEQRKAHRTLVAPHVFTRIVDKGLTYRQVGEELGLGHQTVANYYKWQLARVAEANDAVADQLVDVQQARYEKVLRVWLPDLDSEDVKVKALATDKVLRALNDLNRLRRLGAYGENAAPSGTAPQFVFQQLNVHHHADHASDTGGDVIDGSVTRLELARGADSPPADADTASGPDEGPVPDRDGLG